MTETADQRPRFVRSNGVPAERGIVPPNVMIDETFPESKIVKWTLRVRIREWMIAKRQKLAQLPRRAKWKWRNFRSNIRDCYDGAIYTPLYKFFWYRWGIFCDIASGRVCVNCRTMVERYQDSCEGCGMSKEESRMPVRMRLRFLRRHDWSNNGWD